MDELDTEDLSLLAGKSMLTTEFVPSEQDMLGGSFETLEAIAAATDSVRSRDVTLW